jgi:PPK2 family polyphosphate:nucleotide phosphotransferase
MDAAGKDGAIEHTMSGVNPQGVTVVSFKAPAGVELDHDFLWRHVVALPARGKIGIFNRSHYEEVLVVRVHPEILEAQSLPPELKDDGIWQRRFQAINAFERHLVDNGTAVVKIFLNVSKEEQRLRFLDRIAEPEKHWKFQARDVKERAFWDDYMRAYEEALSTTSTEWAPWYAVPADRKWFARLAVMAIVTDALRRIDPQYPELSVEERQALLDARAGLERER